MNLKDYNRKCSMKFWQGLHPPLQKLAEFKPLFLNMASLSRLMGYHRGLGLALHPCSQGTAGAVLFKHRSVDSSTYHENLAKIFDVTDLYGLVTNQ